MTSRPERIPIPWAQRWEALRQRVVPVICFVATIAACGWLWRAQSGVTPLVTGQVQYSVVEVRAPAEGIVVSVGPDNSGVDPTLNSISKGQICVRLGDDASADGGIEVASPLAGAITKTLVHVGQYVRKGDVLLTVASPEPRFIFCYYPENGAAPQVNQPVAIRARVKGAVWAHSTVEAVGPAIEEHPRGLGNGEGVESGWPVRIALPQQLHLPAGATVDIRFPAGSS